VISGPEQGKVVPLPEGRTVLLGRGKEADVQLNDPSISRAHCQVQWQGSEPFLVDAGSRSGTVINGQRITEYQLKNKDVIQIGSTQLQVEIFNRADQETVLPPPPIKPVPAVTQAKPGMPGATQAKPVPLSTQAKVDPAKAVKVPDLPAERLHELSGQLLGNYQIGTLLAKGQTGLVFQAKDSRSDLDVALKVLWPEFVRDDTEVQRFIRAMKTMLPLRHANLVSLFAAGRTGSYGWLAMELVEGEGLAKLIQRLPTGGKVDWKTGLRIGIYVGRGLEYAHQNAVLHRNVTPGNILVGKRPEIVKLSDLMLAKAMEGKMSQHVTASGELLGDVAFMSPERTSGVPSDMDERSDIYSLGATLYCVLTGRPPFQGTSAIQTILKIRQETPAAPRSLQPSIPAPLEEIVLKMLAKNRDDRFQTANQLLQALEGLARAQKVDF
jgi:pSer/pThr/pTyr-binding forkhead associated (FHA) protein